MRARGSVVGAAAAAAAVTAVVVARRRSEATREVVPADFPRAAAQPVLACPRCHGDLEWVDDDRAFRCPACQRTYPIRDGIVHVLDEGELGPQDQRFAQLYDWSSWVYPPLSRGAFALAGLVEGPARRAVLDRLEPVGRVLEVSIGPGSNLPYVLERPGVAEVHGVDISVGQLRRCSALARRRGWAVPLYLASAEALPFQDHTFDSVFHVGGINFFEDRAKAVAEMARVAKPGTRVVVVDETERGARAYERVLPGFRSSFPDGRPEVTVPIDDVPPGMLDVTVSQVWRGWAYCLEFVTPRPSGAHPAG